MKRLVTLCLMVAVFGPTIAFADIAVYTDEAAYLGALSGLTIVEGFEGSDWDVARSPSTVSALTSQGITWTASEGVTTGSGWARSGTYGVFDSYGDPDMITTAGATLFSGVGGWFDSTNAPSISFEIDDRVVATALLGSSHVFLGVIDTDGFGSIEFVTTVGHWGADDFTFAVVPVPGAVLLGMLGLSVAGVKLRRKSA
jgi:hypothetical protein